MAHINCLGKLKSHPIEACASFFCWKYVDQTRLNLPSAKIKFVNVRLNLMKKPKETRPGSVKKRHLLWSLYLSQNFLKCCFFSLSEVIYVSLNKKNKTLPVKSLDIFVSGKHSTIKLCPIFLRLETFVAFGLQCFVKLHNTHFSTNYWCIMYMSSRHT